MTDNLRIYNAVRSVPAEAQKKISGGPLNGKTDINPMWRIKTLTEQFGPAGFGWWYTIEKQWTEAHPKTGEIAAFCNILLYYKIGDQVSQGIPGTGGSGFIKETKNGLDISDECFKMALTDAISVSCKALGIGADVYWEADHTKYGDPPEQRQPTGRKPQEPPQAPPPATPPATPPTNQKPPQQGQPPQGGNVEYHCKGCKAPVSKTVNDFSIKKFGKPLCMKCQEAEKQKAG